MNLNNPIVIRFESGKSNKVNLQDNILSVPIYSKWNDFADSVKNVLSDEQYDYAVLSYANVQSELQNPKIFNNLLIKSNKIIGDATKVGLPVMNRFDKQMFYLNPTPDEIRDTGKNFVPSDETVLARRGEYEDDYAWQKHQAAVLSRFSQVMPLTSGKPFEKTDHHGMLSAPSRGLSGKDLDDFFSWQSNKTVIPELMGDNMVGIPSIKATSFDDMKVSVNGSEIDSTPLNLKTMGMPGAMIPMKNPRGDSPKYQIASDISPFNVILKARAADGVSIQKSELSSKSKSGSLVYNFELNGKPSNLTVESASNNGVTFKDANGTFKASMKEDIKPLLINRGYNLPPLIDSIKPEANAKYIWMSPGNMVGSSAINDSKKPENNRITPSTAGFIEARKPAEGKDEYVVLVAEGALKGIITAKYLNERDENGNSVGDFIAKDRGIIVAQVPGVAASFVKSVDRIYDEKNVIGTYIAMDADGRENLSVARGIHSAFEELGKNGPVKVMSWNPDQKGIDDALIAIAQHKITVEDMEIHFGKPEKLFPLEEASAPNPYKLDGSRANKESWKSEYESDKAERDKKISDAQKESTANVNLSLEGLNDLVPEDDIQL